jgi:uncharacterized OB-fold protein
MSNCPSCGAGVDASDRECPYCGASIIQKREAPESITESSGSVYSLEQDADGRTQIRFGDGLTGKQPSAAEGVSSHYRHGGGSHGNVTAGRIVKKLDQIDQQLARVPDPTKQKGSRDVGIVLLESMSTMGDLMSEYESSVADEAHLSTDDRDRISKKEERIRPKLKAVIAFCERVDSKTQKKMGLSDSDVHNIRTTATRTLQMTESLTAKCPKCGSMNKPGSRHCQNCGANI